MFEFAKKHVKLAVVVLILCSIAFSAGYYSRKPEIVTKTFTQLVQKTSLSAKAVIDKTRTTTTTTQPDGTVIHSVTQNDVTFQESNQNSETTLTDKKSEAKTTVELPKYAIGAMAQTKLKSLSEKPTMVVTGGYRLFGSIWLDGMYNHSENALGAGLRWEIK